MILTKKLTQEEQQDIVQTLFGFNFEDVGEGHIVLYDEEGYEFYGSNENCQFNFSTLAGVFNYTAHRAKNQGFEDAQYKIRKALGL
jgi:hypothetical protein